MGGKIIFNSVDEYPELSISSGAMTHNKTGFWRVMRPEIDLEKCTGCGLCWKFCPDMAISMVEAYPRIDYEYCKGCGICVEECPRNCITISREVR